MQKLLFLFGELNDDDIDWMIANGEARIIESETILIQENQPIDYFYILLEGKVSVYVGTAQKNREIAVLNSGEILGEMSFIDAELPSASVKSIQESLVLSIDRAKLANRLIQDVGFASRFYRAISIFLSTRLRATLKYIDYEKTSLLEIDPDEELIGKSVLVNMPFAKARYDWLLRHVEHLIEY